MAATRIREAIQHESRKLPVSPAEIEHDARRAASLQNRIADAVTAFAGSMVFVYVHIVWFAFWISLPVEKYPFGLLTMIVSLEAIFLSTFVMISQNRADARRQVFANEQYQLIRDEDKQNQLMIQQNDRIEALNKSILALTQEVHEGLGKK
ncbi:MAG: DUF1003 domain-containing protein [Gaiellaceae bacterium]